LEEKNTVDAANISQLDSWLDTILFEAKDNKTPF
jgi:hypothetical protein